MPLGTPITFSDNNTGYRPPTSVVPSATVLPLIICALHTGSAAVETVTQFYEAADTYKFAVVLLNFGQSFGIPNDGQEMAYLKGGSYTAVSGTGALTTQTSLGINKTSSSWAPQLNADPHKVLGTGWSAGGAFFLRYVWLNTVDDSSFSILGVAPVSDAINSGNYPNPPLRTTPIHFFYTEGTNDVCPWDGFGGQPITTSNGNTVGPFLSAQQMTEHVAKINGWGGTTVPGNTKPFSPGGGAGGYNYIWQWDYTNVQGTSKSTKYRLISAGANTITAWHSGGSPVHTVGESGGGTHYWSRTDGATEGSASAPASGNTVFNQTDEVSSWAMNTVFAAPSQTTGQKTITGKSRVLVPNVQATLTGKASIGGLKTATQNATARITNLIFDGHKNFAFSNVLTAPSPANSGTALGLSLGDGAKFPTPPFNATIWPVNTNPNVANAEIVRVLAMSGDSITTMLRAQEGTTARTILVGDQISATITAKTATDMENQINTLTTITGTTPNGTYADIATRLNAIEFNNIKNTAATAYTFVLSDATDIVNFTANSAVTATVPAAVNVNYTIGTSIILRAGGIGTITVAWASPVVVNSRGGLVKLAGQYAYATLVKVGTDTWDLTGDLA